MYNHTNSYIEKKEKMFTHFIINHTTKATQKGKELFGDLKHKMIELLFAMGCHRTRPCIIEHVDNLMHLFKNELSKTLLDNDDCANIILSLK